MYSCSNLCSCHWLIQSLLKGSKLVILLLKLVLVNTCAPRNFSLGNTGVSHSQDNTVLQCVNRWLGRSQGDCTNPILTFRFNRMNVSSLLQCLEIQQRLSSISLSLCSILLRLPFTLRSIVLCVLMRIDLGYGTPSNLYLCSRPRLGMVLRMADVLWD